MAEPESHTLAFLRRLDEKFDRLHGEVGELRTEIGERLGRIEDELLVLNGIALRLEGRGSREHRTQGHPRPARARAGQARTAHRRARRCREGVSGTSRPAGSRRDDDPSGHRETGPGRRPVRPGQIQPCSSAVVLICAAISSAVRLAEPSMVSEPVASPVSLTAPPTTRPIGLAVAATTAQREDHARHVAAAGPDLAAAQRAQAVGRHLEAFDRRPELGRAFAESDQHALAGAALLDRDEVASQHDVADLRRRLACGRPPPAVPGCPQLRPDQLLGDLARLSSSAELRRAAGSAWRARAVGRRTPTPRAGPRPGSP